VNASPVDDGSPAIGWLRAILTTGIITVVGITACVYVPNFVLVRMHSTSRGTRVAIATTTFFVVLAVLAYVLRRLQARKII
jgi:hypothetical protein